MLDDGVAGLAEIKRCGGRAIAQDPATAPFSSMPANAIRFVAVDHVLPIEEVGPTIVRLANEEHQAMEKEEPIERTTVGLTCPECRGPLTEERQGAIVEYRCRVGHVYSPLTMAAAHEETVERELWAAVVALEEAADINEHIAAQSEGEVRETAKAHRRNAKLIQQILDEKAQSGSAD
jgi:two-component system chemotaxis response regulator CheB